MELVGDLEGFSWLFSSNDKKYASVIKEGKETIVARAVDVAHYALSKYERISTMKLQKIVFYSQAYYVVTNRAPLFPEGIEAWVNGPVVPNLFWLHRGEYTIPSGFFLPYAPRELAEEEQRAVDHVIAKVGAMSGADLSFLTHSEGPWRDARGDDAPNAKTRTIIPIKSIADYYSSASCNNPVFA